MINDNDDKKERKNSGENVNEIENVKILLSDIEFISSNENSDIEDNLNEEINYKKDSDKFIRLGNLYEAEVQSYLNKITNKPFNKLDIRTILLVEAEKFFSNDGRLSSDKRQRFYNLLFGNQNQKTIPNTTTPTTTNQIKNNAGSKKVGLDDDKTKKEIDAQYLNVKLEIDYCVFIDDNKRAKLLKEYLTENNLIVLSDNLKNLPEKNFLFAAEIKLSINNESLTEIIQKFFSKIQYFLTQNGIPIVFAVIYNRNEITSLENLIGNLKNFDKTLDELKMILVNHFNFEKTKSKEANRIFQGFRNLYLIKRYCEKYDEIKFNNEAIQYKKELVPLLSNSDKKKFISSISNKQQIDLTSLNEKNIKVNWLELLNTYLSAYNITLVFKFHDNPFDNTKLSKEHKHLKEEYINLKDEHINLKDEYINLKEEYKILKEEFTSIKEKMIQIENNYKN